MSGHTDKGYERKLNTFFPNPKQCPVSGLLFVTTLGREQAPANDSNALQGGHTQSAAVARKKRAVGRMERADNLSQWASMI